MDAETDKMNQDAELAEALAEAADAAPARRVPAAALGALLAAVLLGASFVIGYGLNVLTGDVPADATADTGDRALPPALTDALISPSQPAASRSSSADEVAADVAEPFQPPVAASLQLAEQAWRDKDFAAAEKMFGRLWEVARANPADSAVADYLRYRRARCMLHNGRRAAAAAELGESAGSDSPAVGALGAYDLAVLHLLEGKGFLARSLAYACLATGEAGQRALAGPSDPDYLIARVLSAKVISYSPGELRLPEAGLWAPADPLEGLGEPVLRTRLAEGIGRTREAALGPKLQRVETGGETLRYSLLCHRAPLEEVLQRLDGTGGMQLRWANVSPTARRRTVTMDIPSASPQRICEIAVGMVGLIVRFTGREAVVHDPMVLSSLAEKRQLICDEAVSAWQRFLLRAGADAGKDASGSSRLAAARLALGVTHEAGGDAHAAIQEYELVAARFPRDSASGQALLHSADLRIRLKDFNGARQTLLQLLNLHPECESLGQVYIKLAAASLGAGAYADAAAVYRKVYHLGLSDQSRRQACLGCARASALVGDHRQVCEWAERYLQFAFEPVPAERVEACLLLGRSLAALERLDEAAAALNLADDGFDPNRTGGRVVVTDPGLHARVLMELALVQQRRGHFALAFGALGRIVPERLEPSDRVDYVLAAARVYRAAGLPDKAERFLRRHEVFLPDTEQVRLRVERESARCAAERGDWALARRKLTELLVRCANRQESTDIARELMEACLQEGKDTQVVTVGMELMRQSSADRDALLAAMGEAWMRQKRYDRAAMALAGLLGTPAGSTKAVDAPGSKPKEQTP